jgi:hypothetical protein
MKPIYLTIIPSLVLLSGCTSEKFGAIKLTGQKSSEGYSAPGWLSGRYLSSDVTSLFAKNRFVADSKFNGREFMIVGEVYGVEKNSLGEYCIRMSGEIKCYIIPEDYYLLSDIEPNTYISLTGEWVKYSIVYSEMTNCRINRITKKDASGWCEKPDWASSNPPLEVRVLEK